VTYTCQHRSALACRSTLCFLSSCLLTFDYQSANTQHQLWQLSGLRECCFDVSRAQRHLHSDFSLARPLFSVEVSLHTKTQPILKFHTKNMRLLERSVLANSTSMEKCSWLQVQHAVEVVD